MSIVEDTFTSRIVVSFGGLVCVETALFALLPLVEFEPAELELLSLLLPELFLLATLLLLLLFLEELMLLLVPLSVLLLVVRLESARSVATSLISASPS